MTSLSLAAVIIDDEPLAIEGMKRQCAESGRMRVVGEASDGLSGLELLKSIRADVAFVDISMPGMSGLQLAKAAASLQSRPLIVFVTAHDRFAIEAFDLGVVDYLLKPVAPERMYRAIDRLEHRVRNADPQTRHENHFWVPFRGSIVKIGAAEIQRLDAERDYIRIVCANRSYLIRMTLTEISNRLDPTRFVRIHRSTIMAFDRIVGFRHVGAGAWVVIDPEGAESTIGRSYLADVRRQTGHCAGCTD